ncbi:PREDICTED: galactinol synthase 5 isoform X1 [Camelina sativa]|uniref:Hexosyltransferase n=1 Tax=Camelina sativa TaxID=90675 RepID=A0ABM0UUP1_CAMSA|nr:PREDICTED: galactinol synthase 5 isoform X1 [Camelina sativa]
MSQMTMNVEKKIGADVTVIPEDGKRAYVTFLAGNKDYWMGVVGLAKGLRKVKSAYPLVVAILPDVPEEHRQILVAQGCIIREIEPVYPPENKEGYSMAYYVINYSKLRIWEFVEYEKMIYLDGDIQVFRNIDHLFDTPRGYLYAVKDCFCEVSWTKSPQYKIGYCQQSPEKVTWPVESLGAPPPAYFNAGMLIFEPNLVTYEDLLRVVQLTTPTLFAEQDFLNMYFKDIYKPIPSTYNLILAMLWRHPEHVDLDQISVVHYCANGSKPWKYDEAQEHMEREDIKMLVKKWWDIYEDSSLDYKNFGESESKLNQTTAPLASKDPAGDVLTNLAPSAA